MTSESPSVSAPPPEAEPVHPVHEPVKLTEEGAAIIAAAMGIEWPTEAELAEWDRWAAELWLPEGANNERRLCVLLRRLIAALRSVRGELEGLGVLHRAEVEYTAALQGLLVFYRTGKYPSEALLAKLDDVRERRAKALAAREADHA